VAECHGGGDAWHGRNAHTWAPPEWQEPHPQSKPRCASAAAEMIAWLGSRQSTTRHRRAIEAASEPHVMTLARAPNAASSKGSKPEQPTHHTVMRAVKPRRSRWLGKWGASNREANRRLRDCFRATAAVGWLAKRTPGGPAHESWRRASDMHKARQHRSACRASSCPSWGRTRTLLIQSQTLTQPFTGYAGFPEGDRASAVSHYECRVRLSEKMSKP